MKQESWQERFDKSFTDGGSGDVINNGCMHPSRPNGIKQFIFKELEIEYEKGKNERRLDVSSWRNMGTKYNYFQFFEKQIKQEIIKKIEKLKDVRITEKQLQHLPNLKGIRCAGFSQCKKLLINKLT